MITISNLQKSFKEQPLFSDVTFQIGEKEKIGLIGRNGSGKSTFIKMLLGKEDPEQGAIKIPDYLKIRALEQDLNFSKKTILEQVCSTLSQDLQTESWKVKSILMGLGFQETDFIRSPKEFSSGFQMRICLAEALVSESDLLLLDEPTNYLDILSLRWLERFLKNWKKALLLITHDQRFMEKVVTHVVGIHRGKMRKMQGGPGKLIQQIKMDEEVYEKTRFNQEKKQEKTKKFIESFRAGARSAGLVQSRIKALEKQKINEKLAKIPEVIFNFRYEPFRGNSLLQAEKIFFTYEKNQKLIENFSLTTFPGDRIAIIGRNGQGKSTLAKLLIGRLQPQTGSVNIGANLKIAYFGAESKKELSENKSILEELVTSVPNVTEQQIRTVCGSLLFSGTTVKKTISKLSGGEKSRVSLAKILLTPVQVLVLDEPTNHLDLESCQALIEALKKFEGTIIFVTHDEEMLSQLATRLVVFGRGNLIVKEENYTKFLESGGWREEENENIFKNLQQNSATKEKYLERKKQKKRLRYVQNRQKILEKELEKLEEKQIENIKLFQKACESKNQNKIKKFGEIAKNMSDKNNLLYQEFEEMIEEEDEIKIINLKF